MRLYIAFAGLGIALCAQAKAEPVWVEQHAKTADHAFLVQLLSYDDARYAAKAIRVIDRKTGALVQEIDKADGNEMSLDPARFLRIVDANADGHPDIQVSIADGGAGPNNTDYFYLFDARARQYRFHKELSELTQVGVDADGTIHSASRGGCCMHGRATYRFIRGRLTLLTTWDESLTGDGKWLEVSTGALRGGKMHYKSRRRPRPSEY